MKITLAQISPELGNKGENIAKIAQAAKKSESDLLVFGELFLTGYMCRDDLTKLAEYLEGDSVGKIVKVAEENDTHIIVGMPEKDDSVKGIIYNTAALICPDGRVEQYRKLHLANFGPFEEHLYFGRGKELPVFDTKIGKIGMLICFDCFFPEVSKIYALKGAELLACISASPSMTRPFFEKVIVARAIENTLFFSYTNLVGTELNMVFWGGNSVIGPRGEIKVKGEYYKEGLVSCEIDLRDIEISREYRPTIKSTNLELFEELRSLLGKESCSTNDD